MRVAALLLGAATATGGLAGFAAGLAAAPLASPRPHPALAAGLVAATALADGLYAWRGRPAPLAVGTQVPRVWSRLFAPETVALLYGARMGVGPLTILPTWSWWTALALGALTGVGSAVLAGGLFGAARVVVMLAVAEWARHSMAARIRTLRRCGAAVSAVLLGWYAFLIPFLLRGG